MISNDIPNSSHSGEEINGRAGVIGTNLEEKIVISLCNTFKVSYFKRILLQCGIIQTLPRDCILNRTLTFSSFRSVPVCRNSSIFSDILAPTPSC